MSNTLIAESVGTRTRASAFGYFSSLSSVAAAFSPLIGGVTIALNGYLPLFLMGGALTLFAAVFRAAFLQETLKTSPSEPREGINIGKYLSAARGIFQNRSLIVLITAYSIYNLFVQQSSFITPLYASKALGYGTITSGLLFSVLLAAVAVSKIYFGRLSDKYGRKRIVITSWIGESLSVYLFVFANSLPIAVLGMGLWMLFGGNGLSRHKRMGVRSNRPADSGAFHGSVLHNHFSTVGSGAHYQWLFV